MWKSLIGTLLVVPWAVMAQEAKVVDNPMDGSRSVQIKAKESYQRADGSQYTPVLTFRCSKGLNAHLLTGGVQFLTSTETSKDPFTGVETTSVRKYSNVDVQVKFDDAKPKRASWLMEPDHSTLFLWPGFGGVLKAQVVYIEFTARDVGKVVSIFNLAELWAELGKCRAR
jgi:hypothetical protein